MIEKRHNGNHFLIYDSIQELPVERFFKFNLQMALDAGIGGDVNAIMARQSELKEFIRAGKKSEALQAVNNMENTIATIMAGVSPETNAFVCLVHSCNGVEVTDLSQEGMTRYLAEWSRKGLTYGKIRGWVTEVKKKMDSEMEAFFPEKVNDPVSIQRASTLKARTLALLRWMQGVGIEEDVRKYDEILLGYMVPKQYAGHTGLEVQQTNGFEDAIVVIRKELNIHDHMTAHQFLKHSATVKTIIENRNRKK